MVALLILALIAATSLYGLLANQSMIGLLMLRPFEVMHRGKWYQLVTSGFVHASFSHLLFNGLTFFFFGPTLEQYIGSGKFAIIFFGSLILSHLPTVWRSKDDPRMASLGASGAVSGVLFGFILFNPSAKLYLFFIPIGIPAAIFGVLFVAYSIYADHQKHGFINHNAHLWGALAGAALTLLLSPYLQQKFFAKVL